MAHATPLSRSKTSALSRVLDLVPRGYTFYTSGECPAEKAFALAQKFHARYGIGCTPAERLTRKNKGEANALLVLYWPAAKAPDLESDLESGQVSGLASGEATVQPPGGEADMALPGTLPTRVSWLLLVTEGTGPAWQSEKLRSVLEKPRLCWLGYELVRHTKRGKTAWTWRRSKTEMEQLYSLLSEQLNRRHTGAVHDTLVLIARQPGFAGVREQSWALCEYAKGRGYDGALPHLFYVQKVGHGERLVLT